MARARSPLRLQDVIVRQLIRTTVSRSPALARECAGHRFVQQGRALFDAPHLDQRGASSLIAHSSKSESPALRAISRASRAYFWPAC